MTAGAHEALKRSEVMSYFGNSFLKVSGGREEWGSGLKKPICPLRLLSDSYKRKCLARLGSRHGHKAIPESPGGFWETFKSF